MLLLTLFRGGVFNSLDSALRQVWEKMIKKALVIIDVGGESTRVQALSLLLLSKRLSCFCLLLTLLSGGSILLLSVDTSTAEVIRGAAGILGAGLINDSVA